MRLREFFATHPVFRTDELAACQGGRSRWTRNNLLAYHLRQGHLLRIQRGLYAVVPPGQDPETCAVDPYLVAAKATTDSVLAYHTAMELHGRAHSVFHEFYFLSHVPPRPRTFRSLRFRGVLFPKALREKRAEEAFTESVDRRGVAVKVTSLERTLVDLYDRPDLGGGWEEIWHSLQAVEYFDPEVVVEYVRLLDNRTTAAKVGYYLEQNRARLMVEERHLESLRMLRPRRPHYLERTAKGKLVDNWNLVVPRVYAEKAWEEP